MPSNLTFSYAAERLVSGWYWVGGGNGMSYLIFALVHLRLKLKSFYHIEPYFISCLSIESISCEVSACLVLAGTRQNEKG